MSDAASAIQSSYIDMSGFSLPVTVQDLLVYLKKKKKSQEPVPKQKQLQID